ncbi:MAG: tetratricopeptide repeat protein [Gammaproteobacteria bacterium]|nr:tetratricopeptide repeat protein [Gammaproteobacteria bacterium]MCF6261119.1 tetratricopeptide repeat protein [Gammaproteobacteria bacterium]
MFFITAVLLLAGCAVTTEPTRDVAAPAKDELPKIDPKVTASYEAALSAMRAGKTTQAEKALQQLTTEYPNYSGPQANLGILYFQQNELEKAKAAFQASLKINPKNIVSLNHLGIISRGAGEFEQALTYYEKALQIDPDYAYAHLNFGILLELYMGKLPEALEHYQQYQKLTPEEDVEVKKWIVDLGRRAKK